MDLSKLSNEDLIALKNKQYDKLSNEGLMYLKQARSPGQPQPVSSPQTANPQPRGAGTNPGQVTQANQRPETKFYGIGHDLQGTMGTPTPELVAEETKNYGEQMPYAGALAGSLATGPIPYVPTILGAGAGAGAASYAVNKLEGNPDAYQKAKSDAMWKGIIPEVGGKVLGGALESIGNTAGKIAKGIENAKTFQWAKNLITNEHQLNPALEQELDAARKALAREQIAPRIAEQNARAGNRGAILDLGKIEGIHPEVDEYINSVRKAYRLNTPTKYDPSGVIAQDIPETHEVPLKDVVDLRGKFNDISGFKRKGPYLDPAAEARDKAAQDAGDYLRNIIGDADETVNAPEYIAEKEKYMAARAAGRPYRFPGPTNLAVSHPLRDISDELNGIYSLRNSVLTPTAEDNPASVFAANNLSKGGKLSEIDKLAGTNLRQQGIALDDAQIALNRSRSQKFIGDQNPTPIGLAKFIGAKAREAVSPAIASIPDSQLRGLAQFIGSPQGQALSQGLRVTPRLLKQISDTEE